MIEKSHKEILAEAVVGAWQRGEPDGHLLYALYVSCGMSPEHAKKEVKWHSNDRKKEDYLQ